MLRDLGDIMNSVKENYFLNKHSHSFKPIQWSQKNKQSNAAGNQNTAAGAVLLVCLFLIWALLPWEFFLQYYWLHFQYCKKKWNTWILNAFMNIVHVLSQKEAHIYEQEYYRRVIKVPQNQNMWVVPNTLPALPLNINGSLPEESEAARHDAPLILGITPMLKFGLSSSWPLLRWGWIRSKIKLLPSHGCLTTFYAQSKFKQPIPGHNQKCRLVLGESVNLLQNQGRGGLTLVPLGALCWTVPGCAHFEYIFCFLQGVLYYSYCSCSILSYWCYNGRKYFH